VNPRKVSASRRIQVISEHSGDSVESVEVCEKEALNLGVFQTFEKKYRKYRELKGKTKMLETSGRAGISQELVIPKKF
jgi:hypothetical protein